MSKGRARNPQSYLNEQLLLEVLPELLEEKGFASVVTRRRGQVKLIDARNDEGDIVTFWLKQGWTDAKNFCAVQFGMFATEDAGSIPDADFVEYVGRRVENVKALGATHALLVHMYASQITHYVVMRIDDVAATYREQMAGWPRLARNHKSPTLYFEGSRSDAEIACAGVTAKYDIPLEQISGVRQNASADDPQGLASKKITAEIERRMRQQLFRLLVGERFEWKCPISGVTVREVLDAAHLPGRHWREHNSAEDGVLLRADLHRLLDRGLAEIRDGRFHIDEKARIGEYAVFHNRSVFI